MTLRGGLVAPNATLARGSTMTSSDICRERRRRARRRQQWDELGQKPALYCVSDVCSSFQIASGSPPALFTASAHFCLSGSADCFHKASWSSVILYTS